MVIADTEVDNEGAIAFFKAMGFSLSREHLWLTKTLRRPTKKVAESEHSSTSIREPQEPKRWQKEAGR